MLSFQDHRTSDIGEDFLRFLPYMGMVAILDTTSVLKGDPNPGDKYVLKEGAL